MDQITIHEGELACGDVQQLLALHVSSMQATSPPHACHVMPADALHHPSVSFFTAREAGRLVAIGALKELGGKEAELKSMRTAPEALGRGIGRAMLDHLLEVGRRRGYRRISLETGCTESFAPAIRLYESGGFVRSGPFGGYPVTEFTLFMSLDLQPALHPC